jgi:hypothetical protein
VPAPPPDALRLPATMPVALPRRPGSSLAGPINDNDFQFHVETILLDDNFQISLD